MGRLGTVYIGGFNDHLPHDRLAKGQVPKRNGSAKRLKAGAVTRNDHLRMMQDLTGPKCGTWGHGALDWLVAKFMAGRWHPDGTTMTLRPTAAQSGAKTRVRRSPSSPETLELAEAASGGRGSRSVLGGPPPTCARPDHITAMLGGGILITMGVGAALASDYHYPSPRRGRRSMLARQRCVVFGRHGHLVSGVRGGGWGCRIAVKIATGKRRPNLLVLDAPNRPRRHDAWRAGRVSYMTGDIARAVCPGKVLGPAWPFDNVHMAHLPPRFNIRLP